jgi:hypothetical protein
MDMQIKTPLEMSNIDEITDLWIFNRKKVLSTIEKLNDSEFQFRPPQGGWSFSEVCEHLYLTQWNIVRAVPIVALGKTGIELDEQPNLDYSFIIQATAKPTGFKNPENVAPLNNYPKVEIIPLLKKSEDKMLVNTKEKPKSYFTKRGLEHPAFGNLNLFNFLWVMALHEGLHAYALEDKLKILRAVNP